MQIKELQRKEDIESIQKYIDDRKKAKTLKAFAEFNVSIISDADVKPESYRIRHAYTCVKEIERQTQKKLL